MNKNPIINNEKFLLCNKTQINQKEINEYCIECLNFIVNKSLVNILNYIEQLFKTNLIQINNIKLSFKSILDYSHFRNKEIKTVFNLEKTFIDKTNFFSFLYTLTIQDFAVLTGFVKNTPYNIDEDVKTKFKLLNNSIKNNCKNNEINFDDYSKSNPSKKNMNKFDIQNFKYENENNETENTTPENNIILPENEKKLYKNKYENLSNENINIFDNQPNENKLEYNNNNSIFNNNFNKEKNIENNKNKVEIEEIIDQALNLNKIYEDTLLNKKTKRFNNYENCENKNYLDEMDLWIEISKRKLS